MLEFWLRIQSQYSNYKRKFICNATDIEEVSGRRNGLRKQVTEVKEGPLKFRKEKCKGPILGRGKEGDQNGTGVFPKGVSFHGSGLH